MENFKNQNFCLINDLGSLTLNSFLRTLEDKEIRNIFLYSKSLLQLKDQINLDKLESAAKEVPLNIYYCKKSADKINLFLKPPFLAAGLGQLVEFTILSKNSLVIGAL